MNPMNPLLILREEIVCLVILVFLTFISRAYRMGKDGRIFNLILTFAMLHVCMDGFTVWTVNHMDQVSPFVNTLAHWMMYMSAIMFSVEMFGYVLYTCYPQMKKQWHWIPLIPAGIYAVLMVTVLDIRYEPYRDTMVSVGTAPTIGFALCFVYFCVAIGIILVNWRKVGKHIKALLLPMLLILIVAELIQMAVKEFLFTGGALTVITVAFFFTLENPVAVLERKVMMDAISGLRSRSSYEHDMVDYEKEFEKDRTVPFTFMFIDINNLRSVNGLFGHQEGDSYISGVAVLLMTNLRAADHIYRMGGDEFLAIYHRTDEKTVIRDVKRVHEACRKEGEKKEYTPELAIGYAVSDEKYANLRDVLRVADYMMYRNKADLKREAAAGIMHETGTRLNLSGLTDRVFDAMCLTGERYYPYIKNMDTDVTRLAPAMVEFFGLPDEFMNGFEGYWLDRVHPEDREGYAADVNAAIRGSKEYHYYKYRVRDKHNQYVEVTCRGGLYHGRDGEPDIFCGYIVNHGAPENVDQATGLMNHLVLEERVREALLSGLRSIVIKLEVKNTERIRMLYGNKAVESMFRSMGEQFKSFVRGKGELFSRDGAYFMIFLPRASEEDASEIYQQIREHCMHGILTENVVIPVEVLAGAVELPAPGITTLEAARSAGLYASEEARFSPQNKIVFYHKDTAEFRKEDMELLKSVHLECVTDRSHFFLRFQPIIQSETGKVTGAEALLRWQSEAYGEVAPGRFISFLENDPGYMELGYDIIRMALREAGKIREKMPDFNINVNMTALQLYADDFIPKLRQILKEEDFPAEHLIMELTERCKEMEFSILKQRVSELKAAGIRVALDDMGTGFSTIDLLLHLPVDEIKLDMEFTKQLPSRENDSAFANVLCEIAARDNMYVCFEGVETEELKDYLKQYGDVLLQGYYFDKPLKAEEFEEKYCG